MLFRSEAVTVARMATVSIKAPAWMPARGTQR
jgi:hypothetical protein